jgi:hypothetical protein
VADLEPTGLAPDGQTTADASEGDEALSVPEMRFIDSLGCGASLAEAAKAAGISERSARRWKRKPQIASEIRARMSEACAIAKAILARGAERAATAAVGVADGTIEASPTRLGAIRLVLENTLGRMELEALEEKLSQLEASFSALGRQ